MNHIQPQMRNTVINPDQIYFTVQPDEIAMCQKRRVVHRFLGNALFNRKTIFLLSRQ
ncbi:MAG: hypothetical protein ACFC1C_01945 [Candidatus Malihini olakiniferum]